MKEVIAGSAHTHTTHTHTYAHLRTHVKWQLSHTTGAALLSPPLSLSAASCHHLHFFQTLWDRRASGCPETGGCGRGGALRVGGLCGENECVYGGRRRESGGVWERFGHISINYPALRRQIWEVFFPLLRRLYFLFFISFTSSLSFRPPEI